MRHDSLKGVETWSDPDIGLTWAVLPEDFLLWLGTGWRRSSMVLPDGRVQVSITDEDLAYLCATTLMELHRGGRSVTQRRAALVELLAGPDRWAEASAVTAVLIAQGAVQ